METTNTNTVEINANEITVSTLDRMNSFLDNPSIKFCLMVLLLYSLDIIDTMTMAKNSLNNAVT